MKNTKSIILAALSLGLSVNAFAQTKFNLNGYGRSVMANNRLSGTVVQDDISTQKKGLGGYNLFDLQTNLAIDSAFKANAILRAYSPFGSFFGSNTAFEFRQFTMSGKLKNFKYEIGDVRVELTPFTVFNPFVVNNSAYEADIFAIRREINEYENYNDGNTWLLQGLQGQYFYKVGKKGSGLGVYAFVTRNRSTDEAAIPNRMLSGGRVEYRVGKTMKFGVNNATMYDLVTSESTSSYSNMVLTGDVNYTHNTDAMKLTVGVESGMSNYTYGIDATEDATAFDTVSYQDAFFDLNAEALLKKSKVKIGLGISAVGAEFSSPSAQSRRINDSNSPALFSDLKGGNVTREARYFDRVTAEDLYVNQIGAGLTAFLPYYNNATPYGKATPNRVGGGVSFKTDTTNKKLDAGFKFDYLTEMVGEGGDGKRSFMVVNLGAVGHLGKIMNSKKLIDVNAGFRLEQTGRSEGATVDLTSMLIDFGTSIEVVKRVDLLLGLKVYNAVGNEYMASRNVFNEIDAFTGVDYDLTELIYSGGVRVRFTKNQFFTMNYNLVDYSNKLDNTENYGISQFFVSMIGKF